VLTTSVLASRAGSSMNLPQRWNVGNEVGCRMFSSKLKAGAEVHIATWAEVSGPGWMATEDAQLVSTTVPRARVSEINAAVAEPGSDLACSASA